MKTTHKFFIKKNLIILSIVFSFFSFTPTQSKAWGFDIVYDPLMDVSAVVSAISNKVSAITAALQVVKWAAGVAADAKRVVVLAKQGNYVRNLVLGSVGNDALLVSNPQLYAQQQGKKVIRENLDNINKANGLYGDVIASRIINSTRNKGDAKTKITAVTKSSIPKITQDAYCNDDELTKIREVAGEDEPQDPTYNTRTEELYDKLCTGNPDTNFELASALLKLSNTNPSWATIIAKTGGDNSFTKTIEAQDIVNEEEIAKENASEMDRLIGKGIRSQTECTGGEVTDENGYSYCPSGKEVITKLSSQVNDSMNKALDSVRDLLSNSYGSVGLFAFLGDLSSLMDTTKTTMTAFSDLTDITSTGSSTNNGSTIISTSTYSHTLTPGVGRSLTLIDNVKTLTNSDKEGALTLQKIDSEYGSQVNDYLSKINTTKSCFDSLVVEFPDETIRQTHFNSIANNPGVIAAFNYLNPELSATQKIKSTIEKDLSGISTLQTLINTTIEKVSKSDSVEEIIDLQDLYINTIKSGGLPNMQTAIDRSSEKSQFVIRMNDSSANGPLPKLTALDSQCIIIGQAERSARDSARSMQ